MNWIEVNGCVLRYQLRRVQRPRATLVLIHEMGGALESWDSLFAALPADVQALRYDTRGAGLSEKVLGDLHIDTHVADLIALLDALSHADELADFLTLPAYDRID